MFGGVLWAQAQDPAVPKSDAERQALMGQEFQRVQDAMKQRQREMQNLAQQQQRPGFPPGGSGGVGRGGNGGGFGGGFGGPQGRYTNQGNFGGKPGEPRYRHVGDVVYVTSANNDSFTVFAIYPRPGKSATVRFPAEDGLPRSINWTNNGAMFALVVDAPKLKRLDVYIPNVHKWYSQDLKQPHSGAMTPIMGNTVLAYRDGRYVYAFGTVANKWGVLELPEGFDAEPVVGYNDVKIEKDGHLYEFNTNKGEWIHTDLREAIKAAIERETKGEK